MTIGGGWWGYQQLRKRPVSAPIKASSVWWCIAWAFSLVAAVGYTLTYLRLWSVIDATLGMALLLAGHQAMHIAQSKERTERRRLLERTRKHGAVETAEDIAARRDAMRDHDF